MKINQRELWIFLIHKWNHINTHIIHTRANNIFQWMIHKLKQWSWLKVKGGKQAKENVLNDIWKLKIPFSENFHIMRKDRMNNIVFSNIFCFYFHFLIYFCVGKLSTYMYGEQYTKRKRTWRIFFYKLQLSIRKHIILNTMTFSEHSFLLRNYVLEGKNE